MSDTPDTDALLDRVDGAMTLIQITRRERDEARAALDKTIAELEMWRDGCIVREEDKIERDEWRKCAELLAESLLDELSGAHHDGASCDAGLAEFYRLKKGGK